MPTASHPLHILMITPGLLPAFGGSSVSEACLSAELRKDFEVRVWCRLGKLDTAFAKSNGLDSVETYHPLSALLAWIYPGHSWNQLFSKIGILHINGHWKWENFFFCKLAQRHRVPCVLHPRGMFLVGHRKIWLKRIFNRIFGNAVMRQAAKIIALSRFEVRQFEGLPIAPTQIAVIPNGISVPALSEFDQGNYFLYLGRIERRKNLLFLLEAFKIYRENGGLRELHLVGPVERDYDRAIHEKKKALGLSSCVHLLSPMYGEEKWKKMRSARGVIYPTLQEPFGRVPFEALAIGGLPIVPDESGSAEYLSRFLPDILYRAEDATSLATVLAQVEHPSFPSRKVAEAKAWVLTELNWNVVGREVRRIYEAISKSSITSTVHGDLSARRLREVSH
jgi:glycosyltransferase involved in cell wall biosynthesis